MGPTGRGSAALHFPSRNRETTMVGARTVPNAGRAGAVLGVAALMDAAAAPEGGVMIFPLLIRSISYQRVASGGRPFLPAALNALHQGSEVHSPRPVHL